MPEQLASESEIGTPVLRRLVFRIPTVTMLAVVGVMVCAVPFAFSGLPWLLVVYVFPVLAALWILRNRTTADAEGLVARSTFGRDVLPWSEVTSLRVSERTWVRAVLADSREVPLPAVRLRHLPMLAAISGGRFADPSSPRPAEGTAATGGDETDADGAGGHRTAVDAGTVEPEGKPATAAE
ncbi:MAG: PH domain-containing protein [Sciscionella sp.]